MAKKTVRVDGAYLNAFSSVTRGRMGNYGAEFMSGNMLLPQPLLQSLYIHNGFARLICDKPAEEMTRAGFEIEGLSEELTETVQSRLEELDAVKKLNEALKWRRAFGGGILVLGLKDGGKLEDELNEDNLSDIEFIRVYDRFEAYPSKRYEDPNDSRYGNVELWKISPKAGTQSYDVHETRVLVFDGESVPNDVRLSNLGWGSSVLQNCFVQLTRLDSAHKWALLLVERMQQAVHGIPDLAEQISDPIGEKRVTDRVNVVDAVRSSLNTVIIDALETYEVKSMSLTGVNEILDRFAEACSAVSSIPVFILMGRSVGGLNSTGDASKEGWYAQVESWQNDQLRKPLDRLISLIILCESEGDSDGGKYTIEFNPLFTPSDKDMAEIEYKNEQAKKVKMETLTGYVNAGIVDQDEVRDEIREDYELEGDVPDLPEEPKDPIVLNENQRLVPNPNNPAPVGK